jgi:hypothetical protein
MTCNAHDKIDWLVVVTGLLYVAALIGIIGYAAWRYFL